jgi:phospholipid/cholesterol/gamma-HCH transport system substrate-binding protein
MRGLSTRRLARVVAVPLAVASAAIGLSGCMGSASPNSQLTTYAEFADVDQLVGGAPVDMADIPIGHVDAITLAGDRAKVEMTIERSAGVPAAVKAELEQTSVLGDYFVQLVPTKSGPSGLLANDAMIEKTGVQPEIEQLVQAGSQVFGAIPDTELAEIVQAGGQGFGGQSSNIRQLLDDLSTVTAGYASRDGEIQSLINNLNQLGAGLAPSADTDAQAISNLSATIGVLQSQSTQFINLLQALDNLSIQGHSLLGGSLPEIDDELTALSATAGELAAHQQDIALLVQNLPYYNAAASGATMHDFIQVFEDIIVCGVPGGGEDDSSPATTCAANGGGGS